MKRNGQDGPGQLGFGSDPQRIWGLHGGRGLCTISSKWHCLHLEGRIQVKAPKINKNLRKLLTLGFLLFHSLFRLCIPFYVCRPPSPWGLRFNRNQTQIMLLIIQGWRSPFVHLFKENVSEIFTVRTLISAWTPGSPFATPCSIWEEFVKKIFFKVSWSCLKSILYVYSPSGGHGVHGAKSCVCVLYLYFYIHALYLGIL